MFANIMENCQNWDDEEEVCNYLNKILDKEAFDKAGLIYGMGHAVYTLSDPRAVILKKGMQKICLKKKVCKKNLLYMNWLKGKLDS